MITYEEVCARLFANADAGYRDFHKKLLKNDRLNVIGVRIPAMRKLAKEWKAEWTAFSAFSDEYYEVTFLKCTIVSMLPFEAYCKELDGVVSLLDNWATCDCFHAPCVRKRKDEYLPYLEKYLADGREFVKRFALVGLLHDYVEEKYLPVIFDAVRRCGEAPYYVMMAAAWLIAEVLAKYYAAGVEFLREKCMPAQMHNKAIQKARESFRLTSAEKEALKRMKR